MRSGSRILKPCQTSNIAFCANSQRLKNINHFCKKNLPLFDRVLIATLEVLLKPANIGAIYCFQCKGSTWIQLWVIEAKEFIKPDYWILAKIVRNDTYHCINLNIFQILNLIFMEHLLRIVQVEGCWIQRKFFLAEIILWNFDKNCTHWL